MQESRDRGRNKGGRLRRKERMNKKIIKGIESKINSVKKQLEKIVATTNITNPDDGILIDDKNDPKNPNNQITELKEYSTLTEKINDIKGKVDKVEITKLKNFANSELFKLEQNISKTKKTIKNIITKIDKALENTEEIQGDEESYEIKKTPKKKKYKVFRLGNGVFTTKERDRNEVETAREKLEDFLDEVSDIDSKVKGSNVLLNINSCLNKTSRLIESIRINMEKERTKDQNKEILQDQFEYAEKISEIFDDISDEINGGNNKIECKKLEKEYKNFIAQSKKDLPDWTEYAKIKGEYRATKHIRRALRVTITKFFPTLPKIFT